MTSIVETLKADYLRFPENPTFDIYAEDVYFKDPMNEFRGIQKYRDMLGFIETWFKAPQLELHHIEQVDDVITTRWTLFWTAPVPWKPRVAIPGWTEMKLNASGLIESHIDQWEISRWNMVMQIMPGGQQP